MLCEHPLQLKSGLVVPCGKCLLCLSHRRDQWSIRMQLHAMYQDTLPFFGTFTYDNAHMTYGADSGTLVKRDFQLFIKRLKDRFQLYNSDFGFFAAGEYGDSLDRPHFHAILYGMLQLKKMYDRGFDYLNSEIAKVWQNGFVYLGPAEIGGIHYTAKYVLKYATDNYDGKQKPFMLASKGLGAPWLQSPEARYLKTRLDFKKLKKIADSFIIPLNLDGLDFIDYIRDVRKELAKSFPKFVCHLVDGRTVPLPQYLKRKLVGSFEDPLDNPFWIVRFCDEVLESWDWSQNTKDYDVQSTISLHDQLVDFAKRKIKQRLILNNQL